MSIVTATVELDQVKGTVKFWLDLQGTTELDHEILAAAIGTGRSVSIVPAHKGNELFAEFTIADESIWPKAIRALTNRKRIADGRPTVEEEEAQAAMRAAADQDRKEKAAASKKQADEDAKDAKDREDARIAQIASEAAAETFHRLHDASKNEAPVPTDAAASKENVDKALEAVKNLHDASEHS